MLLHKFAWLIFAFSLISCSSGQDTPVYSHCTVQELKSQLDNKHDIIIIDVRTSEEISSTGKVPGSITIDFYDPAFDTKINKLPKDKPVYVYCAAGGRSSKSLTKFEKVGFKTTYSVDGGMGAWQHNNYPTEK